MKITSYLATYGHISNANGGMIVEDNKLREIATVEELEKIVGSHQDLKPESTSIVSSLKILLNPLFYITTYNKWRVKRWIQKRDCNFAYLQIGSSGVILDYFNI